MSSEMRVEEQRIAKRGIGGRNTGQGDNTTGPVPSHMGRAISTMIATTKITTRIIFAGVDLMDPHSLPY